MGTLALRAVDDRTFVRGNERDPESRSISGAVRLESFPLELGGVLEPVDLGYTLYGSRELPLVVVLGGISAGRHIRTSPATKERGWWDGMVGPGRSIDTREFAVLGMDFLGGMGGSTGPTGPGFPAISTGDQADAIAAVLDHLGIARAHAVVGSSYGGMVALSFASRHRSRLMRQVVISAAHGSHPMATALRALQRRAVRMGIEGGAAKEGMALARGIAMTTYRTTEEFAARFNARPEGTADGFRFPVEAYLEDRGADFAGRFSPWSFLCLSESLDLHRVAPAGIETPTTLVSVDSDTLVPSWQVKSLAEGLGGPARLVRIQSIYGHDAFLKEVGAISRVIHETLCDGGSL